ncbi:hypothetical protein [Photobacterium phosphoreum]|uniref:hypothetical protein n=1 Tax=Photobacterium phosphoreum TaxID=659 RepID=UPI0024B785C4|nr:hypothetical protein [Photobacterium phosphoreum]
MEDSLLNTIPIYYDKNLIVEKRYKDSNGDYSPVNLTKINIYSSPGVSYVSDFEANINANIYYVFGCGVNSITDTTKFTLIPYTQGGVLYFPADKKELIDTLSINTSSQHDWEAVLSLIEKYKKDYNNIVMETTPKFNPDFDVINSMISKDYDYTIPSNKISVNLEEKIKYWDYRGAMGVVYGGTAYTINNINVNIGGRNLSGNNEENILLVYPTDTPILPDADYPINNT